MLFSSFFYCLQNKIKQKKNNLFSVFFFSSRSHLFSSTVASSSWFFPFLSFDSRFVKFKSNGTIAKRPLKRIQKTQENTGSKRKSIFLVFLGVFAWIYSEIKRGWIFPEIEWMMDFLGNQTGVAKKKIIIITWLDYYLRGLRVAEENRAF